MDRRHEDRPPVGLGNAPQMLDTASAASINAGKLLITYPWSHHRLIVVQSMRSEWVMFNSLLVIHYDTKIHDRVLFCEIHQLSVISTESNYVYCCLHANSSPDCPVLKLPE